jgi:hypothetical protein
VPIYDVATTRELVERSAASRRFVMQLLAAFAGGALLLAALGHLRRGCARRGTANARDRASAWRSAPLRATSGGSCSRAGPRSVAAGLAAGVAAALAVMRLLSSLLYEVSPRDPLALSAAAVALGSRRAGGALDSRAARRAVAPLEALREE